MSPHKDDLQEPDTETLVKAVKKANEKSGMLTANTLLTAITVVLTAILGYVGSNALSKLDTLNTTVLQLNVEVKTLREQFNTVNDELREHDRQIAIMWNRDHPSENHPTH